MSGSVKSKWSSQKKNASSDEAAQPLKVTPPSHSARTGAGMTDSKVKQNLLIFFFLLNPLRY